MEVESINNKSNNANRKKFYLTLTFILLSLFFIIFITQFTSLYAINSFAASTPSSVNYPVHLAYFYEPGCHDCDKVKIVLKDISAKYPVNLILKGFDISLSENVELAEPLSELIQKYSTTKTIAPWEKVKEKDLTAQERLIARFQSFGLVNSGEERIKITSIKTLADYLILLVSEIELNSGEKENL